MQCMALYWLKCQFVVEYYYFHVWVISDFIFFCNNMILSITFCVHTCMHDLLISSLFDYVQLWSYSFSVLYICVYVLYFFKEKWWIPASCLSLWLQQWRCIHARSVVKVWKCHHLYSLSRVVNESPTLWNFSDSSPSHFSSHCVISIELESFPVLKIVTIRWESWLVTTLVLCSQYPKGAELSFRIVSGGFN